MRLPFPRGNGGVLRFKLATRDAIVTQRACIAAGFSTSTVPCRAPQPACSSPGPLVPSSRARGSSALISSSMNRVLWASLLAVVGLSTQCRAAPACSSLKTRPL
jgi:hypothetical protein